MKSGNTARRDEPKVDLDSRYGAVGISAVAAALRYQSECKNSAYARAETEVDERFVNAA